MGAHPLFSTLSRRGLNPIKLAHSPSPPDNGLGQYVSSPGNRAYCYAELAVSSLAMAVIITSTHFAYLRRDGQAELAWVSREVWLICANELITAELAYVKPALHHDKQHLHGVSIKRHPFSFFHNSVNWQYTKTKLAATDSSG